MSRPGLPVMGWTPEGGEEPLATSLDAAKLDQPRESIVRRLAIAFLVRKWAREDRDRMFGVWGRGEPSR